MEGVWDGECVGWRVCGMEGMWDGGFVWDGGSVGWRVCVKICAQGGNVCIEGCVCVEGVSAGKVWWR